MSKFSKAAGILVLASIICFFLAISSFFVFLKTFIDPQSIQQALTEKSHLGVVRLIGPIFSSEQVLRQIELAKSRENCKGLLVRIDSPGGAVGASQEIYLALKAYKTTGNPVIVSMGNTAASGGYYAALAADTIFANPGTLTGSIGVIASFPDLERLFEKAGVSMNVLKSGDLKDAGSLFRPPTKKEKRRLQHVVNDSYSQFFSHVLAERQLDSLRLKSVADGRVLTGREAMQYGLIDSLGTLLAAKAYLLKSAGLPSEAKFIDLEKKKHWMEKVFSEVSLQTNEHFQWFLRLVGTKVWYIFSL